MPMKMLTRIEMLQVAEQHAATLLSDDPEYRMGVVSRGKVVDGWLFSYQIRCLKDIPPDQWAKFAGAAGLVVTAQGAVRDLNGPMYFDAEKRLLQE